MFSATRLIALVATVALGTGALFFAAGQGPSPLPAATVSPLPSVMPWTPPQGLVTEEVEPGVVRILGDDAGHDLTAPGTRVLGVDVDRSGVWVSVMMGHDPDSRTQNPALRLIVLGQPDPAVPPMSLLTSSSDYPAALGATPTGPWAADQPRYLSFGYDGGIWLPAPVGLPDGVTEMAATAEGPDGRLWAAWHDPQSGVASTAANGPWQGRIVLGRYDEVAWTMYPVPDPVMAALPRPWQCRETLSTSCGGGQGAYWAALAVDGEGVAWLGLGAGRNGNPPGGLLRFSDGGWSLVDPIGDGAPRAATKVVTAPDGSIWAHLSGCVGDVNLDLVRGLQSPCAETRDPYLVHHASGGWTVFTAADGVPMTGYPGAFRGSLAIAAGGTAWMSAACGPYNTIQLRMYPCDDARTGDLVHSFDGERWQAFVSSDQDVGLIEDMDVAPDGTLWFWGDDGGLFRIDPRSTGG